MFDLHPARITLRRKFEARMWRGDEPFSNYYHEKVLLANRVPVADEELLDHEIELFSEEKSSPNDTRNSPV